MRGSRRQARSTAPGAPGGDRHQSEAIARPRRTPHLRSGPHLHGRRHRAPRLTPAWGRCGPAVMALLTSVAMIAAALVPTTALVACAPTPGMRIAIAVAPTLRMALIRLGIFTTISRMRAIIISLMPAATSRLIEFHRAHLPAIVNNRLPHSYVKPFEYLQKFISPSTRKIQPSHNDPVELELA